MRLLNLIALCLGGLTATAANHTTIADISRALRSESPTAGSAQFTVTMPQLPDDVIYNLYFTTTATAPTDTLAPCNYLIEWGTENQGNRSSGFSAYFDGHHYRYAGGEKIQEFHMEWDTVPFMPSISAHRINKGVQRTARFADILPAFIAETLEGAAADTANNRITIHRDTLVGGTKTTVVDILTTVRGAVARESEYVFDRSTLCPRRITLENNPGSISEQTVSIDYGKGGEPESPLPPALSEQALIDRYHEEFSAFRNSNFRIENLRGKPLPGFSLPTLTGERYSRRTGEPLRTPTMVVLLESGLTFNPQTVEALRQGADMLPYPPDIVWIFTDSHADSIEETLGQEREGEHRLMSGRGFVRDCGAAMLPTILMVDTAGRVDDLIIGFNNNLASDVIQKMNLIQ